MKRNKKQKAEISKFNPVPRYRAYGVTRKEYAWVEHIKLWLVRIAAIIILGIPSTALAVGSIAVLSYSSLVIKTILWTAIASFAIAALTKKVRIRLKFNKKLKKFCDDTGCELCFERKLSESLKWSPNECDITVITQNRIYYLHTLYISKARQRIVFESAQNIKLITSPPKSRFVALFDIKPKVKNLSLDLSCDKSIGNKEAVSVILVLPGCLNMSYRQSSVSTVPTGNGGEHFGYTIFTAKGFMNFLPRYEENLKK